MNIPLVTLPVVAALMFSLSATAADLVEIQWDAQGVFSHSASVSPGKFLEACGKLRKGQVIEWSFTAGMPTDFNIHYHVGDKVEYPEKRDGVAEMNARLKAPLDQDYCWMWKSRADRPIEVKFQLVRR